MKVKLQHPLGSLDPLWLGGLLGVVVISGILANIHLHHSYTADDVVVQVLARSMLSSTDHHIWVGPQTFVLKLPLYWLIDRVWGSNGEILFWTIWLQAVACFTLFYIAALKICSLLNIKRQPMMVATLWVFASATGIYTCLINPNVRSFEIGIAFVCIWGLLSLLKSTHSIPMTMTIAGLCALGLGLISAGDGLLLYMVLAPLVMFAVAHCLIVGNVKQHIGILSALAGAAMVVFVVRIVMGMSGLTVEHSNTALVSTLEQVRNNFYIMRIGLFKLLNVDFRPNGNWIAFMAGFCNLGVLVLMFGGLMFKLKKIWSDTAGIFLCSQVVAILAVFMLSAFPRDPSTFRYLILIPFYVPLIMAWIWDSFSDRTRCVAITLMLVAAGLSLITLLGTTQSSNANKASSSSAQRAAILAVLKSENLTKGYADYWDGPPLSYFSNNQVAAVQAECQADGSLSPYYWYLAKGQLTATAERSYLLFRETAPLLANCHPSGLVHQFGQPTKTIAIDDGLSLFIFDYDITSKMQLR